MKTSELQCAALDWAVANCEGLLAFGYRTDGERLAVEDSDDNIEGFMPSTDWSQGGPIIERERILIQPEIGKEGANNAWSAIAVDGFEEFGPTPMIAAMRCFVASRMGENIQIPDELI